MGKTQSSPKVDTTGDHDLTIIQTQEVHSEYHESHDVKLNIVLVLLLLLTALKLWKVYERRIRKRAYAKARQSVLTLA